MDTVTDSDWEARERTWTIFNVQRRSWKHIVKEPFYLTVILKKKKKKKKKKKRNYFV